MSSRLPKCPLIERPNSRTGRSLALALGRASRTCPRVYPPSPALRATGPLSVLSSWMIELRRFCPSLRAVKLHSSDQEERKRLMQTLAHQTGDVDVVVTTYE